VLFNIRVLHPTRVRQRFTIVISHPASHLLRHSSVAVLRIPFSRHGPVPDEIPTLFALVLRVIQIAHVNPPVFTIPKRLVEIRPLFRLPRTERRYSRAEDDETGFRGGIQREDVG
jgi:hypothetical protein